jgi:HTH-type transcriptional regulator/antitoxin HigA
LDYENALSRAAAAMPHDVADAWIREFPAKALIECGLKRRGIDRNEALRSFLAYFGVPNLEDWHKRYASYPSDVAFRNSTAYETIRSSLAVWLRQGEIEATKIPTARWDAVLLKTSLTELRKLTRQNTPAAFIPRARTICARAGVAVVFVKTPQGCRASGASRFLSRDKAMIILSFRHKADDQFWFTFFHEIAHLLFHNQELTFVDQDDTEIDDREQQANGFAAATLIPPDKRDEMLSLRHNMKSVIRFASSVGASPGIVVGQMQYAGVLGPDRLNFLKRRWSWNDIATAFA